MICAQKRNERSLPISYHQKKEKESLLTSHVFPTQTKTRHQSHAVNDGANCLLLTSHYFPTQTLKTLINTELFVILLVDK